MRGEWPAFFDSFSRQHEGCGITLELFGAKIGSRFEERVLALEGITAKVSDVVDSIAVMIAGKPNNHITHTIAASNQVSLEQTDEGGDVALLIKGADQTTMLLRFGPEMVETNVAMSI